jgi:hypothetical protein
MDYKQIGMAALFLVASGCSANKYSEKNVQLGGEARASDLAYIHANWSLIKNKIVDFDERNCVATGLSFENLEFLSVEGLARLSMSATNSQHNIDPDQVKKIFGLEFSDPCGSDASPAWVIVDTTKGFSVIDFIQIEE